MRITPAMKQEAKTILFYFAILAIFIWALSTKTGAIKDEINTGVQAQCRATAPEAVEIIGKYNDVVKSLVVHEKISEKKDLKDGLGANAANDAALVSRLEADEVKLVQQDCSKDFLR